MPDILDRAQQLEEQSRTHAINQARSKKETPLYNDGERVCLDCLCPVPRERIHAVDATRCIECQTFDEFKSKQRGG